MKRKVILLSIVAAILLMACSCPITNLINRFTNPQNMAETIIENIPENLPEQLPGELDELLEEVPEFGELEEAPVPENIPLLTERNDDLTSVSGVIIYSTPLPQDDVQDFYETEMPNYGWTKKDNGFLAGFALEYENDIEEVQIFILEVNDTTQITITIIEK